MRIFSRRRRRQHSNKYQLLVPQALLHDVIRENHDPAYAAHHGVKRTCDPIALHFWWPGMRRSVEDYIRKCDACQRRKENCEFIAPLGDPEMRVAPFQITSMDITGPYPLTPRRNKYILTFIDHFTKFVVAFAIPDQSAQTCARIYATQIVTRHGSGSKLVTDQGAAFISAFISETCKVLGVQRSRTSIYHPAYNGVLERWHRALHDGMSHYVNSSHSNWDLVLPFFLMPIGQRPSPLPGIVLSSYYMEEQWSSPAMKT